MNGIAIRLKQSDNINTDYIISGRYKFAISDPRELAKHIFEDIEPNFIKRVGKDSILVSGNNFGMGSSREQAPVAIKAAGIKAVIAKSFARIFYRNAFNIGLILIECNTDSIKNGDKLNIDLKSGVIARASAPSLRGAKRRSNLKTIKINPLPEFMMRFVKEGGVVNYFKKHKSLPGRRQGPGRSL